MLSVAGDIYFKKFWMSRIGPMSPSTSLLDGQIDGVYNAMFMNFSNDVHSYSLLKCWQYFFLVNGKFWNAWEKGHLTVWMKTKRWKGRQGLVKMLKGSERTDPNLDLFFLFFFFFWLYCTACRTLVPWPGTELVPSAVKAWCSDHWTASEVPVPIFRCTTFLEMPVWRQVLCNLRLFMLVEVSNKANKHGSKKKMRQ